MGSARFEQLSSAVIKASDSNSWSTAVLEWEIVDCEEDLTGSSSCVCGKEHLRYLYTIRNRRNGNVLFPIGSSCISKFEQEDLDNEAACWKGVFKLVHEAERLGRDQLLELDCGLFSRKILRFMYEHGCFIPNQYNKFDAYNDYTFMVDMFNARYWTRKQASKVRAIMASSVYPFLRKIWRNS